MRNVLQEGLYFLFIYKSSFQVLIFYVKNTTKKISTGINQNITGEKRCFDLKLISLIFVATYFVTRLKNINYFLIFIA